MTTPTETRGREVLAGLRAARDRELARIDAVTSSGFKTIDGGIEVTPEARAEFKSAQAKVTEYDQYIQGIEYKGRADGWLEPEAPRHDSSPFGPDMFGGMPGGLVLPGSGGAMTPGTAFVQSAEFKSRNVGSGNMSAPFQMESGFFDHLSGVEFKDLHSGSIGTFTHPGFGRVERAAPISAPMRIARVRDLFPQANTTAVMIEYVEELGFVEPGDNAAATVAERMADNSNYGLKPKSTIRFDTKSAPIKTIAHWVPAHRNTLADEPTLRGIIDMRLLYGLKLEEDRQLLLGNGLGENLLGLLNTAGVQQYPGAATPGSQDTYVDAARRAMTRVMLAEYEATGLIVHPYDWERMELTKDLNGNYVVAVNVVEGARKRLWQVPVIATPAIPEGTALTGAFGLGAQVYDREQANIRTADQHADFFVRNAVAILAEERVGLVTWRPEAFVEINLADSIAA